MPTSLPSLRKRIDRIDLQLLRLLNRRAALALRVGRLKRRRGLPVFDRQREAEVLRRLARANQGPFPPRAIAQLFRHVLRQSRALEASATKVVDRPPSTVHSLRHNAWRTSATMHWRTRADPPKPCGGRHAVWRA